MVMTHKRSHAREVALQLLFQRDLNPEIAPEEVERFAQEQLNDAELQHFALELYQGTCANREQIDERLSKAAENWRLTRMAVIDRNILRLGAFELEQGKTPASVVLNEAIELARRFGSADSPSFINGVLDRLYKDAAPLATS